MAKNQTTVECPLDTWTNVTGANTTALTFQVLRGPAEIFFKDTGTAPADSDHGYSYKSGEGEANLTIADLAASVSSAALWVRPLSRSSSLVLVDFA